MREGKPIEIGALLFFILAMGIDGIFTFYVRAFVFALLAGSFGQVHNYGLLFLWLLLPFLWASLAWLTPSGNSYLFRRRSKARSATQQETAHIMQMFGILNNTRTITHWPHTVYIIPDSEPNAFVIGQTLYINTGMLELPQDESQAVLAHELGHMNALDGRLCGALNRLTLPLCHSIGPVLRRSGSSTARSVDAADNTKDELASMAHGNRRYFGILRSIVGVAFALFAGGLGTTIVEFLMQASGYSRAQEYAADTYAAEHGQAVGLLEFLGSYALVSDTVARNTLFAALLYRMKCSHAYTALRIDRLWHWLRQPQQQPNNQQTQSHAPGATRYVQYQQQPQTAPTYTPHPFFPLPPQPKTEMVPPEQRHRSPSYAARPTQQQEPPTQHIHHAPQCPSCFATLPLGAKWCASCGAKLTH